jgi:hypothetical protein
LSAQDKIIPYGLNIDALSVEGGGFGLLFGELVTNGLLDEKARSLIWALGGHYPALWYHNDTKKIEELPNTGMPAGPVEDASFEQVGLKTGDVTVIGTAIVAGVNVARLPCLANDPDGSDIFAV